MSREGFLVKIFPKNESIIGVFGDVVLKERIWGIDFVLDDQDPDTRFLKLSKSNLLQPHSSSDYITLRDAIKETGYTQSKLLRYVKSKKLEGIKIRGKWLILKSSLEKNKNFSDSPE
jgi:hypothetical protein